MTTNPPPRPDLAPTSPHVAGATSEVTSPHRPHSYGGGEVTGRPGHTTENQNHLAPGARSWHHLFLRPRLHASTSTLTAHARTNTSTVQTSADPATKSIIEASLHHFRGSKRQIDRSEIEIELAGSAR